MSLRVLVALMLFLPCCARISHAVDDRNVQMMIETGSMDELRNAIGQGSPLLEQLLPSGMTPLNYACQRNRFDVVRHLVEQHAEVNVKSINGMTPFMSAILAGNVEMSEYLLAHGAKWNGATADGLNALHLAAQRGLTAVVDKLIGLGMKPDLATPDGVTPLYWAVWPRSIDAAKRLIEAGADVRHVDQRKRTALHFAANRGSVETIQLLLEHGAIPGIRDAALDRTELHIAASTGRPISRRGTCLVSGTQRMGGQDDETPARVRLCCGSRESRSGRSVIVQRAYRSGACRIDR